MLDAIEASARAAEALNEHCQCVTLDEARLSAALPTGRLDRDSTHAHLFAHAPVFLPRADGAAMLETVVAIEAAVARPSYRAAAMERARPIARHDFGPRGAFMGYDFHMTADGPRLIEINTNAGGAYLNAALAQAQRACCAEVERGLVSRSLGDFEADVTAMFEAEWRAQRGDIPLRRIAIVDDDPPQQYLLSDFVMARDLMRRAGYSAEIIDARALKFDGASLLASGKRVDLVYNRLVDFDLSAPDHAALQQAYVADAVVVTPNPHNHALMADKRNLVALSDPALGLLPSHLAPIIPRAFPVTPANADELWAARRGLFFKPAQGHGGKAVYRGDKLTRRVWADVTERDYIAQTLAPPSERAVRVGDEVLRRKADIRLYTYGARLLIAAARLYQGQTTNFRTPGGGFAPVFFV